MPKIHPIIFSGDMVRALLAGRKTQTRRLSTSPLSKVEPGDLLYVRERFRLPSVDDALKPTDAPGAIWYDADGAPDDSEEWSQRSRPAIHLPRDASRLTLLVRSVNLEALQDISEADAQSEGVESDIGDHRRAFETLWNALHPDELWLDNPEIVALTFEVIHGNVDRLDAGAVK